MDDFRPPPRPHSPAGNHRSQSSISQRSESSLSIDSNESSSLAPLSVTKRPSPLTISQHHDEERPNTSSGPAHIRSTPSTQTLNKQSRLRTSIDGSARVPSPNTAPNPFSAQFGHRPRQHSQGFFEPSLPSAGLSASQIAAQAAMHHIAPQPSAGSQERKRSTQGLATINTSYFSSRKGSDTTSPQIVSAGALPYNNGLLGSSRLAATTAANVAFPSGRSPIPSPPGFHVPPTPPQASKEVKKSSKMKLFSKPKTLNLSKDKEAKIALGAPSPGKGVIGAHVLRGGIGNASTTSLNEPGSSASSLYSSANASTSTLVPSTSAEKEREKDRHRPNFLSRGKHKAKDEHLPLPLSSANSNSQAVNPERPMPLYSFTPDSPSTTSFAKTMSNFDLRHGGRALREKKKEEKAAAAAAAKFEAASLYANQSYSDKSEMFSSHSNTENGYGPSPLGTLTDTTLFHESTTPSVSSMAISNVGSAMGVPGLGPDDVWPLLKARLLYLFSGDSLMRPVEELNILVSSHIERCVRRKLPQVLIEDLRELLHTGFSSLAHILRTTPEDRLVTRLVEMWANVYGAIVPFFQAVFLPLDLEFKGHGTYLTAAQAKEFWAALPEAYKSDDRPTSSGTPNTSKLGDELDVRRITLIAFRDTVILPRHEILMAIFSRLSLNSINAATASPNIDDKARNHSRSDAANPGAERPGTAGSLSPHMSSFNSQASTLLDASSTSSGGHSAGLAGRSRATSNTSAGSFGTNLPHLNPPLPGPAHPTSNPQISSPIPIDPAKITDTVAKMLQCLYVLTSCQTGDIGQGVVERLTDALKYNWLGRGRTGRNRRGWVGVKAGQLRVGMVGA